jgi:hypothetical protein
MKHPQQYPAYNDSGETIPPYAACLVTGVLDETDPSPGAFTVEKPDAVGQYHIIFNGPLSVPVNRYFYAYRDPPLVARWSGGDLPSAGAGVVTAGSGMVYPGMEVGVSAGWALVSAGYGFTIVASVSVSNTVYVVPR